MHLSLLLVTRSLPRRDPQMQIFRCICSNRVDLLPFLLALDPKHHPRASLPLFLFSLFFFFLPQTNVLRLVSYPPCRLLFYLKPEFPSVRARVQIYSKTVQLSRRSNTPVKIRAESSFRKFGNNAFPLLESLLGQRWGKFNNRGYE